ncbi:hypothetical protein Vretimale_15289 [Volvox reticuliferus]|uniref:Fungal lipase-type domain-containing protein n=1 Tax=Volvox reticuliferus TaxID=1737510 RepID=A0A8J4C6P4_9CHLO|nr:hypothetical protein Vretifemale_5484 [Volvox reticuliferus]GIM11832.1 hypothetical protein Vretimale_15289 [Volvox reticuliferus]
MSLNSSLSFAEHKHLERTDDFFVSPDLSPDLEHHGSREHVRGVDVVQSAVCGAQPSNIASLRKVVQGSAVKKVQGITPKILDAGYEGGTVGMDALAAPDATAAAAIAAVQQPGSKRGFAPSLAETNSPGRKRSKRLQVGAEGRTSCDDDNTDTAEDAIYGLPQSGQQIGNQHRDVVLRIEFVGPLELKILALLMVCSLLAGIAITAYFKVNAQRVGTSWYLLNSSAPSFRDNFIAGTICIAIPLALWLVNLLRGVCFRVWRRCWDRRRFRIYLSRLAELTVTIISMAAWTYAGSERRLERDCENFRRTLLWTYAVRLTAGNTLLCIWTMSARGMTVHSGGPLSLVKRVQHAVRHRLAHWWGKCRMTRKGSKSSLDHNEAVEAASGPVSIALTVTATGGAAIARQGTIATGYGPDDEAGSVTAELVVRELKVEGEAASERLAADVVVVGPQMKAAHGLAASNPSAGSPVITEAEAEVTPPMGRAASREVSATGAGRRVSSEIEVEVEAELSLPEPNAVSVAGVSALAASSHTSPLGKVKGPCPPPPQPEQHQQPGPVASQSPLSPPGPDASQSQLRSVRQGTSEQPTLPLPRPGPAAASLARESIELLEQTSVPTWGADSAVGAAAVVAAAAATAVAKTQPKPDGESRMVASLAAKCAAERMVADMGCDEQLHIDADWREYLAPVLWLWVPFECLLAFNVSSIADRGFDPNADEIACMESLLQCRSVDTAALSSLIILLVAEVVYVIIYFGFCLKAFLYLRSRSYVLYRQLNIYLSIEVRIRGLAIVFLVVNDFVQAFIVPTVTDAEGVATGCRFSLDSMLGLWSTQMVTMMVVSLVSWIFTPRSFQEDMPIMQATLQRFAWTERDLPRQRNLRLATVPRDFSRVTQLEREPMFCFETGLKLTYWCEHAYYYEEPGCTMRLPLQKLMDLFNLEHILVIRNEESDAKVMIAWSWKHCLLCFRGTASLKAACVDLKAMLVPYYQRSFWMHKHKVAALAAVHQGFQWSWTHGGFNEEVLEWIRGYRAQHPHGKIMVTGHSLGGAHAVLCALDVVRMLGKYLPYSHLMCYTYGAPRVGDHAFASLYNKEVAETWHIINGNDVVPLTPKYVGWFVYKQPGHKVILKRRGDIIVRPTFTENTVIRLPCSRSLRHHLLGSHIRSMMSVLRNQTRGKHIEGGVRGLLHLSRYQLPEVDAVLQELVQEVREVAAVAVKAVADSSGPLRGLSGGDAHVSSEQAATAVALAAAGAGRGAHTVFNFMVRHNSLKLLLDHQTSATVAATATGDAHAPHVSAAQRQQLLPRDHHAKQLLFGIVRRIDLGMQLLGVETGMAAEDDEDDAGPNGYFGSEDGAGGANRGARSAISDGSKAAEAAELAAFEHAAASRIAAQLRYRRMKRFRAREHRSVDGQDTRPSWMPQLPRAAAAAGYHSVTAGGGAGQQHQRTLGQRSGPELVHLQNPEPGQQLWSASTATPLGDGSTADNGPRGGCDGGEADGGGSKLGKGFKSGEGSNGHRKKLRAARHSGRSQRNFGGIRGRSAATAAASAVVEEEEAEEQTEEGGGRHYPRN